MTAPAPGRRWPEAAARLVACWVGALTLAAASAAATAPPDSGVLVPGRTLGGIALGSSRADVVAAWGRAFGRCRDCGLETLYFNRFAFRPEGAAVELRDGRVVSVYTLWAPPGWRTSAGLRIGEPSLRLEATYGPLVRIACRGYAAYVLRGSGPRSVVYVVDAAVWGFALLGPGRPVCR